MDQNGQKGKMRIIRKTHPHRQLIRKVASNQYFIVLSNTQGFFHVGKKVDITHWNRTFGAIKF